MTLQEISREYEAAARPLRSRLRQLRQIACNALEQAQPAQLAEIPLAPKMSENQPVLRLTTSTGTLEIINADRSVLDQVLRTMLHAE